MHNGLGNNPICRRCGSEEETSVHILCECEALASLSHTYLGFLFWTRTILRNQVWGPSGALAKAQGSSNLVQDVGHKGPVLRPRFIGPGRARPHIFQSILLTLHSVVQGQPAGLQYPSSWVQTRPKPSDFQGEKFLSTPSFGGEVNPSVPCRRFTACKRSLNLRGSRNLGKITGKISRPQFHLSLLGSLASLRTYRHLAAKVGTSKGGGKQWQTTPQELAQDAACQSHTGHMTGLWFLPTRPLRLNTNE